MKLYKISFPTTEKVYIGITSVSVATRFKAHCHQKSKTAISLAIRKYGNAVLTVLAECDDWELLCLAEQEAIEKFNSRAPNGYNLTDGGEGFVGLEFSIEHRRKLGEASKNRSPETRAKLSAAGKRKIISIETREKISAYRTGKKASEETRAKMSMLAKNRPIEISEKISNTLKGHTVSTETREKISLANKGKKLTEETRVKMSLARKGRVVSKETREKMSKSAKRRELAKISLSKSLSPAVS